LPETSKPAVLSVGYLASPEAPDLAAEKIDRLEAEIADLRKQIGSMHVSKSWRLTAPLRVLSRKLRRRYVALVKLPLLGPILLRREIVRRYRRNLGVEPKLNPPVTFNEHITHRILYDRDPRLKIVSDKIAVQEFIRDRVGERYTIPTLGIWESPQQIPWDRLPERFVLKPNHASGRVRIVPPLPERDIDSLMAEAREWLALDFFDASLEWGYRGIPRRLLAQPLLLSPSGGVVVEADVYVFHGRAGLIQILTGEKGTSSRRACWFDAAGNRMTIRMKCPNVDMDIEDDLRAELIEVAEAVARDFSSMRVDFYLTGDGLKIGELTPYTAGGRSHWNPSEIDEVLGTLWNRPLDLSVLSPWRCR